MLSTRVASPRTHLSSSSSLWQQAPPVITHRSVVCPLRTSLVITHRLVVCPLNTITHRLVVCPMHTLTHRLVVCPPLRTPCIITHRLVVGHIITHRLVVGHIITHRLVVGQLQTTQSTHQSMTADVCPLQSSGNFHSASPRSIRATRIREMALPPPQH